MAKIQPSVLKIRFSMESEQTAYVDLSQCLSIVNRRSYRQGLNWVLGGFLLKSQIASANSGTVIIEKLPQTYVVSNSWHKAYAMWQEQRRAALKESPSLSAKWADFKIFAEPNHVTLGTALNLIPVDQQVPAVEFHKGEWMHSDVVVPLTGGSGGSAVAPEVSLHMVGDNLPPGQFTPGVTASASLIEAYAQSRGQVLAPDPVQPGGANQSLYNELAMHDEISEHALHNATAENNEPPYDIDDYPGGAINAPTLELVHEVTLLPSVGSTTRQLAGTNVPCGLLKITTSLPSPAVLDLSIMMVPGKNRGYLTQNMKDM